MSVGIILGDECFDKIVELLGSKKHILYNFEGDSFKTKIYRKDGKLMSKDPKFGERPIIRADAEFYKGYEPYTLKGHLTCLAAMMIRDNMLPNVSMSKATILAQTFSETFPDEIPGGVTGDKFRSLAKIYIILLKEIN